MVLNAFQRARAELPWLHPRHGIVHCQILSEGQLRRMAELNVTASVQPVFINGDMHIAPGRLGGKRLAHSYAWGDMERLTTWLSAPTARWSAFTPWRVLPSPAGLHRNGPFPPERPRPYQAVTLIPLARRLRLRVRAHQAATCPPFAGRLPPGGPQPADSPAGESASFAQRSTMWRGVRLPRSIWR